MVLSSDVLTVPSYQRGYGQKARARKLKTDTMVTELHRRGVSIEDIFGIYYALEAIATARDEAIFGNDEEGQHGQGNLPPLKVSDAELAGLADVPSQPIERQPF